MRPVDPNDTMAERERDLELALELAPDVRGVERLLAHDATTNLMRMQHRRAAETEAVRARLRSEMFWRSQDGMLHEIASMHPRHAHNAARMLMRNAARWYQGALAEAFLMGFSPFNADSDHYDDWMSELYAMSAEEWLESQPQYRALQRRANIQPTPEP